MRKYKYKPCSNCGKLKITKKNKSGLCKECKLITIKHKKIKLKHCNNCNKLLDKRNKTGLCENCIHKKSLEKNYTKCSICKKTISKKNKSGMCKVCMDNESKNNIPMCKKCGINKISKTSKTGLCRSCYNEQCVSPKCNNCGIEIGYRNKSGLCRNCLKIENLKKQPKCKVCNINIIRKDNDSGMCKSCFLQYKRDNRIINKCSKCDNEISSNNKSGMCLSCKKFNNLEKNLEKHNNEIRKKLIRKTKNKKRNKIIKEKVKCKTCEKIIVKNGTGFCRDCYYIDKRENNGTFINCLNCNKRFKVYKKRTKYCSRDCFLKYKQSIKIQKEKNNGQKKETIIRDKNYGKKYCEKHNHYYDKESNCIFCIIDKKEKIKFELEKKGKLHRCCDCDTLIPKNKRRCHNCLLKYMTKTYSK